ncbi:Rpn family recombination-promoting nuclease/putative transposase [Breznakibacter xylanolyticus]|nr:Rpn family recombination-promoting nuclease/putative transposase [Breznakibacter xylanolyticus]
MRYLDPKNDLTFKRIFGEHPHLCKSFLNSMLPLEPDALIEELEYLSPELVPEITVLKRTIVDVRCRDQKGRQFIVEMQMYWTESFKNRVVFNASKAYVKQLDNAKEYKLLQPVYALSLVNETFEPQLADYYHHFKIVNHAHPEKQIEGLEFVFVELPKFKAANLRDKRMQVLWLKFLTEIEDGTSQIPDELLHEALISEAVHILESGSYSKEQLEHYDQYWDSIRAERSAFLDAEERGRVEGLEQGRVEGLEKGRVEGLEKGRIEGIEKGRIEGIEKGRVEGLEIGLAKGEKQGIQKGLYLSALLMLNNKIAVEQVAQILSLPEQAVHQLLELYQKYGSAAENHLNEME